MNQEMRHSKKCYTSFAQISGINLSLKPTPLMEILVVSKMLKPGRLYSTYSPTLLRIFSHI